MSKPYQNEKQPLEELVELAAKNIQVWTQSGEFEFDPNEGILKEVIIDNWENLIEFLGENGYDSFYLDAIEDIKENIVEGIIAHLKKQE
jgi:hypothetical protein